MVNQYKYTFYFLIEEYLENVFWIEKILTRTEYIPEKGYYYWCFVHGPTDPIIRFISLHCFYMGPFGYQEMSLRGNFKNTWRVCRDEFHERRVTGVSNSIYREKQCRVICFVVFFLEI